MRISGAPSSVMILHPQFAAIFLSTTRSHDCCDYHCDYRCLLPLSVLCRSIHTEVSEEGTTGTAARGPTSARLTLSRVLLDAPEHRQAREADRPHHFHAASARHVEDWNQYLLQRSVSGILSAALFVCMRLWCGGGCTRTQACACACTCDCTPSAAGLAGAFRRGTWLACRKGRRRSASSSPSERSRLL